MAKIEKKLSWVCLKGSRKQIFTLFSNFCLATKDLKNYRLQIIYRLGNWLHAFISNEILNGRLILFVQKFSHKTEIFLNFSEFCLKFESIRWYRILTFTNNVWDKTVMASFGTYLMEWSSMCRTEFFEHYTLYFA